jgi:hypothetical protein
MKYILEEQKIVKIYQHEIYFKDLDMRNTT